MRKILIIGATSAIAQATARLFAERGDALFLVARNADKLAATADDLRLRGAGSVCTSILDVLDYDRHKPTVDKAIEAFDGIDFVLIAHGTLPNQRACEHSFEITRKEFEINALSTISLLTHLANYFEERRSGTIVVVSSVAGDRGRQSNYVYGSAKGAVTVYLQGLRNRLHSSGVSVLTIKPGFVDTPMTAGFNKGMLWSTPDRVASMILAATNRKANVVYTPPFWTYIMFIIKIIPEAIFKRLHL